MPLRRCDGSEARRTPPTRPRRPSGPTNRNLEGANEPQRQLRQQPSRSHLQLPPHTHPQKYAEYLFGNEGKRRAVEQFFTAILMEEKPQTLLLFSDENMSWLYEDAAFAARWAELFALPEALVRELSEQPGCEGLDEHWRRSRSLFEKSTKEQRLSVTILHPQCILSAPETRLRLLCGLPGCPDVACTAEQYAAHVAHLQEMASRHDNLTVRFTNGLERSAIVYLKEDTDVIVAKAEAPNTMFAITDATLTSAFRDYLDMLLPA